MNATNRLTELLERLKDEGIQLWLEEGELRFRAAKGKFTDALKAEVSDRKDEIKSFLGNRRAAPAAIPPAAPRDAYPLSHGQQRLWFLSQYELTPEAYHCPALIPLDPDSPLPLLERALTLLVTRHPSLRTRYSLEGAQTVQRIAPAEPVTLKVLELDRGAAEDRVAELIRAPFDLAAQDPWRAELLRLPDECILALVIHHIATDGWSMGVLASDLRAICEALATGAPPDLPELPIQYTDYACWQHEDVQRRIVPEQLPYWLDRLASAPAETTLPTDFPRPAVRDGRGHVYRGNLPGRLGPAVDVCARANGATPFMVLLAVLKLLAMRISGQEDLVVGTPAANRPRPELGNLVGYFVNTLALRTHARRAARFVDYLAEVRAACIGAYAHQELPFELLVARLDSGRDLSRTPLLQLMFSLQTAAPDLPRTRLLPRQDIAKLDINLTLTRDGDGYAVECEYATALFETVSIERLLGCYATLLAAVCDDPGLQLRDYPLLDGGGLARMAAVARGPVRPLDAAEPVHLEFFSLARRQARAPALRLDGQTFDYGQLAALTDTLARDLRVHGVGPGDVVALGLDRSVELVVAVLAVLRCGAAYLPVDTGSPPERAAFAIADGGARMVLVQPRLADLVAGSGCPVRILDAPPDSGADPVGAADWPVPPTDSVAYIIYTSGTTGYPKGVANSHRGLWNRLEWMQRNHPIGPGDRVLQKTNYAFDVSVWELLWPLTRGAMLVLAAPGGHRDPAYLAGLIAAEGITVCHFVPSALGGFLQVARASQLESLRVVFASGEALPASVGDAFLGLGLPARLYNLYGPTEAAIDVSVWDCHRAPCRPGVVPIGRPIDNIELLVLDPDLQPQPPGVPGELYIGGVGLAFGYLGRPGLTAERFIPHPLGEPGERLYRTGDSARWLPDGNLEFLGRLDHQVKLRGLRIELGEIEHHLGSLPGVALVAVLMRTAQSGEQVLVGYVQPAGPQVPSEDELRRALRAYLPEYMIPSRFEILAELPLNTNGKLDRKRLGARPVAAPARVVDCRSGSPTEALIQGIWQEILGLPEIGTEQSFFELGGTSLSMVRVHQALSERLDREIPLVKLFAHPSVRALARFLDQPEETVADETQSRAIERERSGRQRLTQIKARRMQADGAETRSAS